MGKQYKKLIKRRRRKAYVARRKERLRQQRSQPKAKAGGAKATPAT